MEVGLGLQPKPLVHRDANLALHEGFRLERDSGRPKKSGDSVHLVERVARVAAPLQASDCLLARFRHFPGSHELLDFLIVQSRPDADFDPRQGHRATATTLALARVGLTVALVFAVSKLDAREILTDQCGKCVYLHHHASPSGDYLGSPRTAEGASAMPISEESLAIEGRQHNWDSSASSVDGVLT
jgi:hypothetical protein